MWKLILRHYIEKMTYGKMSFRLFGTRYIENNYYTILERIIKLEQHQKAMDKRFNDYIGHSDN